MVLPLAIDVSFAGAAGRAGRPSGILRLPARTADGVRGRGTAGRLAEESAAVRRAAGAGPCGAVESKVERSHSNRAPRTVVNPKGRRNRFDRQNRGRSPPFPAAFSAAGFPTRKLPGRAHS